MPPLVFNILTLFPEIFPGPLSVSVIGKALNKGIWNINIRNIRDYSNEKHKNVDDTPYGGGSGMIMRPDVLGNAIEQFFPHNSHIIYMSPRGRLFNQGVAESLVSNYNEINIICGRFEGIDERVIEKFNIDEISIGDYVISSGDIAAMILIDACVRLLPGVFQSKNPLKEESFGKDLRYRNLLEYPHYTKPSVWKQMSVPNVLLSGNHSLIKQWRIAQSEKLTQYRRQDLWQKYLHDKKILNK